MERSRAWPLVTIGLGYFMVILDTTIVNVALPSIEKELSASVAGLQWVVDGYALVFASLLLTAGALGDRLGSKRVFLAGLVLFTVTSALCGAAPTLGALVAFLLSIDSAVAFRTRVIMLGVTLWTAAQCGLTFSRTGPPSRL